MQYRLPATMGRSAATRARTTRTAWFPSGLLLALALCGCVGDLEPSGGGGPDGGARPGADAAAGAPDAAPKRPDAEPGPRPGDGVEWLDYPELHGRTDASWGDVLTDIVQHIPESQVDYYSASDKVTHGHETSHGIHAHLRNYYNNTGSRANAFYVLEDRAVLVKEPDIRKSHVAPYVPDALRGPRFSTYITGQTAWDDTPLYVWDEWVAYANGTAVGVDLETSGRWTYGWRDACMGTIEFVAYGLAVGMAVEERDAGYFESYDQFREFLAWHARRSLELFRACRVLEPFTWDQQDRYYEDLRSHPDAAPLRDFVARTWGHDFLAELLDL